MYVTVPTPNASTVHSVSAVRQKKSAKSLRNRTFKAGSYLFREGDEAERVYEVVSGVLRLTRVMENGRRQVIAFGYPGDIVGFPCDGEHHTDCDALTKAEVVVHSRAALERGEGDPKLHNKLMQAALREISNMQDHFMMLGRKSASEKVASFLAVLSERVGCDIGPYTQVELPMSRSDIADFLGLTTETVSRTITQLRKCEIIALENVHTVVVLKPRALLAMAEGD
ncbi:MAG: helix-turn-helix domain-containing protein [Paracoccaceae bacterium]